MKANSPNRRIRLAGWCIYNRRLPLSSKGTLIERNLYMIEGMARQRDVGHYMIAPI